MKWPWENTENRSEGYTDARIAALVDRSYSYTAATALAATEAAVRLVSGCFSMITWEPSTGLIPGPTALTSAVRRMLLRGEALFLIRTRGGRVKLYPGAYWEVHGGPDEESWLYTVTVAGPSTTNTYTRIPSSSVIHFRYSEDTETPWLGRGPLHRASLSANLAAAIERVVSEEMRLPTGRLMPVPDKASEDMVESLRAAISQLKGDVVFPPSVSGGWGGGFAQAPNRDYQASNRLQPDPAKTTLEARKELTAEIASIFGVPVGVLVGHSQSAALRESFRVMLFSTLEPIGERLTEELKKKIEMPSLEARWDRLSASDVTGRSRAYAAMIKAGVDPSAAAGLVGFGDPVAFAAERPAPRLPAAGQNPAETAGNDPMPTPREGEKSP